MLAYFSNIFRKLILILLIFRKVFDKKQTECRQSPHVILRSITLQTQPKNPFLPVHNMRKSHYALLFILQLTTVAVGVAQPSAKLRDAAFDLYNRGKYRESLELLTRLEEQKTGDLAVETAIGIAAYNANRLPQAKQYLQLVVANFKVFDPSVFLYLGRVFHSELKFRDAIKFYKRFLNATDDKNPERRRTVGDIRRCAAGLKIIQLPELALVENLGEAVNSRFDEFAPVQSLTNEDRIYFSAAREDADGGLRNDACLPDVKNGHYFNDIYFTELDGGDWRIPNRIDNALINTPRHEQLLDITNGGKTLIFFRSMNALSGDILVDTFKSETEIRSLPPKFISPLHAENGDNTLFFFNDSLLIFSARRPEGFGGLDLYFSVWRYGAWQEPKNLGSAVNSGFDETAPFLAKDGRTLYFSSNSPNSMGGFDIFKSKYDDDSLRFMPPVNLGKPINSAGDDMFFRLTTDGMRA